MLPAAARLTRREDFTAVLRHGARSGRSRLVVHLWSAPEPDVGSPVPLTCARAGLVVSKAVGNAVVRHRVSRRLRHLLGSRLGELSPASRVVVRALAPAATASSAELADDLDGALRTAARRMSGRTQLVSGPLGRGAPAVTGPPVPPDPRAPAPDRGRRRGRARSSTGRPTTAVPATNEPVGNTAPLTDTEGVAKAAVATDTAGTTGTVGEPT